LVTIDPFRGSPLQLVERAVETRRIEIKDARRGRGRAHDQIWCVFDIDEHPNVPQAIDLARRHEIDLSISNPCLELWFLLHFQDQTGYIDRFEAQRRAQAHLKCGKVLTDKALAELERRYADALKRAIKLDSKHRGDGSAPGANPSSGIWRLIDVIRGRGG
jgi:hypothetical protein